MTQVRTHSLECPFCSNMSLSCDHYVGPEEGAGQMFVFESNPTWLIEAPAAAEDRSAA